MIYGRLVKVDGALAVVDPVDCARLPDWAKTPEDFLDKIFERIKEQWTKDGAWFQRLADGLPMEGGLRLIGEDPMDLHSYAYPDGTPVVPEKKP